MSTIIPVDFIDVSRMAATLVLKHSVHFSDDTRRAQYPGSPHHDTHAIILRGPRDGATAENWQADVDHDDYDMLHEWPSARTVLERIAASHKARTGSAPIFGKAMVVSLAAGGHIDWHVDQGGYAEAHDRFHLCLLPSPGAWLFSGGFARILPVGELAWFNNRVLHSAINLGAIDRVHFIVDVRKPGKVQ